MSLSKERYIGRLVGLREVRAGILIVNERVPGLSNGTKQHKDGTQVAFETAADYILATIKDTQYLLRYICNVPTRRDRLYRTR